MGIIFLAQLILAVLAFVFSHEVKVRITTVLEKQAIQRYRDDLDLEDLINWLQETVNFAVIVSYFQYKFTDLMVFILQFILTKEISTVY